MSAASFAATVSAQGRLERRLLLRNPESLLVVLGLPLAFLGVGLFVAAGRLGTPETVTAAALALSGFGSGFTALGISTAFERKYDVLRLLGTTPLGRRGLIVAKCLGLVGVLCVQLVAVAALGLIGGLPAGPLLLALPVTVFGAAVALSLGLALAGAMRAEAALAAINAGFVLMAMLAGISGTDLVGQGAQSVISLVPLVALVDATAAALALDGGAIGRPLIALGLWLAVAVVVVARTFSWSDNA